MKMRAYLAQCLQPCLHPAETDALLYLPHVWMETNTRQRKVDREQNKHLSGSVFTKFSRGIRFQQTLSEKCSLQNKQRMIFFFPPFLGSFFPCARLETNCPCQKI